jgi:hypothetical protein
MLLRKSFPKVLILVFTLISLNAIGQKQVDLDALEEENPGLFSGKYFRGGIGIASANQDFGTIYSDISVTPLQVNMEFGTRIKRKYGIYFGMNLNIMLNETYYGVGYTGANTTIETWFQNSLNIGGLFYLKGGNSYFAPEVGFGVGTIETSEFYKEETIGVHTALKYGYDWHILDKFYLGAQAFISYDNCKHVDELTDSYGDIIVASTFMYGMNLTFKIGK